MELIKSNKIHFRQLRSRNLIECYYPCVRSNAMQSINCYRIDAHMRSMNPNCAAWNIRRHRVRALVHRSVHLAKLRADERARVRARAHTHLRTLNLIVKTIAIGPADSSLSISQNSDHPSWKKQLVFFIENKNRYGTLAQASATTTTTTAAMTITMDIKHNTIIQYTRRLSAKKMRKRERKSFMHATLRIEKFLSSEAFELRIFDAAYSLGGGRGAFIWCIYLFLSFLFW